STGIRTPLGIKVTGNNIAEIERICGQIASVLSQLPGTRAAFADYSARGRYLDVQWDREALARYGITIEEAQATVQHAVAGENVSEFLDGRERYPINVRYPLEFRSDADSLSHILIFSADGRRQIPISALAKIITTFAASMLRNEDGLLAGYIYLDLEDNDFAEYVARGDRAIRESLKLSPGYAFFWAGQYESILRTRQRLAQVVPLTLLAIFVLLYLSTRSLGKTALVLLGVPFSAVGAAWVLYFAGYHLSVAVWVGLIVLMGVDAETGVFMLLYLDLAWDSAVKE